MFNQIVIPIDFSDLSEETLKYARQFSREFDANLELVHVFNPDKQKGRLRAIEDPRVLQEYYTRKIGEWSSSLKSGDSFGNPLPIGPEKCTAIIGQADEELIRISAQPEIELVIMGINGAMTLKDQSFGRVATEVSIDASCPVLLLPPGARHRSINNILVLTDMEDISESILEKIAGMAYFFEAVIYCFHVNKEIRANPMHAKEEMSSGLQKRGSDINCHYSMVKENDLLEIVNHCIETNDVDLFAVITENRFFWFNFLKLKMKDQFNLSRDIPIMVNYI